jgi:hypothetical protein
MLFANESASPLKDSLAYSLVSLYFCLSRVSLAEYFLILKALFPCYCRWSDVLWLLYQLSLPSDGRQLGPWAWSLYMSYLLLLLELIFIWHCIRTKCVCCGFKTNCFRYLFMNLGCNNFMF